MRRILVSLILLPACAAAQQDARAMLVARLDSIARAPVVANQAVGLSVAVVKGNDTLLLEGYGLADLELEVPTPDRAVYEIGSVTKQFTAVAVLQLAAQGKLGLDHELTQYLPDYPTQGHRISIRRLLDHTSGIKGYTEMPGFAEFTRRDVPRDSLVARFAAEPFDFPPGEAMIYNNSAYFLLGLIIEKAAGQPYEQYLAEHVFQPAGMADSRYCDERAVIPRRAHGYERGRDGFRLKEFISHRWPYAAGSVCSTVGDLVAWARALHGHGSGGTLLSPAMYRELITPGRLNDGTPLRYAKGLAVGETNGRRAISHGGGIFGFVSQAIYYPDHDLIVVVLINSTGPIGPDAIARALTDAVLGPSPEPAPARAYPGDLGRFVGTYRGPGRGRALALTVSRDSTGLVVQPEGQGAPRPLQWVDGLTFSSREQRFTFVQRGDSVTGLRMDVISGLYVLRR